MAKGKKKSKIVVNLRTGKARRKRTTQNEVTRLGAALRGLGGLGGAALGGLIGQQTLGGSVGRDLGAAMSKWLGSGDYEVSTNSLVAKGGSSIPMMHKEGQSVIIRHKEFITEVRGSTSFTVQRSINLNPGMSASFPWLSAIASNFQEYRVRGMVFHYIPSSGTAVSGTNPALGTVMMQTSYRATDTVPTDKVELLNEYWSSESPPFESFIHPIECDPKENPYNVQYVRSGNVPSGDSILLYDLGTTHIATSGQLASGNVLGDLWCTYEVELKKPQIRSNVLAAAQYDSFSASAPTFAQPFAGTVSHVNNTFTTTVGTNSLTIPAYVYGTFSVQFVMTTSGLSGSFGSTLTFTNCTQVGCLPDGSLTRVTASSSLVVFLTAFKKTDTSQEAVINFSALTYTGTPILSQVVISQVTLA